VLPADGIAVYGRARDGARVFASQDLARMPAELCTVNVAAFAQGERGPAVRLCALIDAARAVPGTLYVNFEDRARTRRLAHFLTEVVDLGWIAYGAREDAHAGDGAFRLILPGIHGDRGHMNDLAWIELADEPAE
jgi:hypothetical protein